MSDIAERACKIVKERTTTQLMREVRVGFLSQDELTYREQKRRERLEAMAQRELFAAEMALGPLGSHVNFFGCFGREAGHVTGRLRDDAMDVLGRIERIAADLRQNIAETAPRAAPVRLQAAE